MSLKCRPLNYFGPKNMILSTSKAEIEKKQLFYDLYCK